ncbi:aminoacyl-tRNA hydrolase [Aspergillus clavatus NRRL 1]|uniref:Peptidyl-tRNA hydrolase, putative n=1 Tax=Aspergillus clavatus (strain ATCC 1007 / CBS 513.65 / DSM 816 / NCTC 3887 / NRRL 1 / QM 1276 / 107) TaxID=344612 RepID=A1C9T3_ASPCL|nr:peptidyl-tRNA hydrolase, putative [Aspergillus clavatus NRRL 1]EAW12501.1 peptidyl-tRNA hydrolase, putative [Aspergillus clavatus NRRL 1]
MAAELKIPRRFLFIASIGNPRPYRQTRHSAGHILLDALVPLLPTRMPLVSARQPSAGPIFYKTWYSPSYMNESGTKLVRQLKNWMSATQTDVLRGAVQPGDVALPRNLAVPSPEKAEWQVRGVDPSSLKTFQPTLVILHDELEAPLGKVKVKRGGPEKASLRGHRGLISAMESLRGKGLYPPRTGQAAQGVDGGLSVLRVGVGIGRPSTRTRNDVADYVLTEMNAAELAAVRAAAVPVLDILADELYRAKDDN